MEIDSLLDKATEHQQSGLITTNNGLFFNEGYKYALQKWKKKIEFSDLDDFINNLPFIASNIEQSQHNFRKGKSFHPEAIRGRKEAGKEINRLVKAILWAGTKTPYFYYLLFLGIPKFFKQLLNIDSEALIWNLF